MNNRKKPDIFVDYEYGDLKEIVVGVPFLIYPDLSVARWLADSLKVLPESEAQKVRERSGKDAVQIGKYDIMEEENKQLIAVLEKHGVKVWRPELLSRERVAANFGEEYVRFAGACQQYVRDPIAVIGDHVIENAMGSLYRRADILGFRKLFLERVLGSGGRWVSMPGLDYSLMVRDGMFDKTGFPVLEGGDVVVLGRKVLVGTSENRATGSSELGYLWLESYLAPFGYDVERVRLTEDILHLDIVLSVPRPGLFIECPGAFVDGIPSFFDGWERIELAKEEVRYLAANGLPIDKSHYIMGYNDYFDGEKLAAALEGYGVTVYRIPFGHHTEDGGSIRCSTHPLVRRMSEG